MPIELTKEVLELMGWDEINEITSSNQAERNTIQIKTLGGELESTKFSPEGKKSLEGDIEKLKRTGRIPKEAGINVDFGDISTDTTSLEGMPTEEKVQEIIKNKNKLDVDSITPALTPELRSFLGMDREAPIQVAEIQPSSPRTQIEYKKATGEDIFGRDIKTKETPPTLQEKPVKYIDEEQEKKYIERRREEERRNKPIPSTPKLTPEQLQEIEDIKGRKRQEEMLKVLERRNI